MTTSTTAPRLLCTTGHPTFYDHPDPDYGDPIHRNLGRLLQPRHTSRAEDTATLGLVWACDNDAYVPPEVAADLGVDSFGPDKQRRYLRMLDRVAGLPGCKFVTVPDVVANAAATLTLFERWVDTVRDTGLPVGIVAQDGCDETGLPWDEVDAVFIGGSDPFKDGPAGAAVAREAKARGKWVHWGRVSGHRRLNHIVDEVGAYDSFDGSKWARWRKAHLDTGLRWTREIEETGRAAS